MDVGITWVFGAEVGFEGFGVPDLGERLKGACVFGQREEAFGAVVPVKIDQQRRKDRRS